MQHGLPSNSPEDLRNLVLEKRQVEAERATLQVHSQKLSEDKEILEKQLEERETEINELKAAQQRNDKENEEHVRRLEE